MDINIELDKFNNIKFFDKDHIYTIRDRKITSTTSVIHKFQEEFDTEYWANRKAEEKNIDVEDIKKEWKFKNRHAIMEGKTLHTFIENYFNNKITPYPKEEIIAEFGYDAIKDTYKIMEEQFLSFAKDVKNVLIPIRSEVVVGDEEIGICGMVDMLFYNKKMEEYQLWDWKTSTRIRRRSYFNKQMLFPLDHLDECEFNSYSLQLATYKYIIERNTNIKLGNSYIVWFNEKNASYEVIKCAPMSNEVNMMVSCRC